MGSVASSNIEYSQNLAIGVRCSGYREVLGIWIEQTEGAKFWLRVMIEIRNRGAHDVLIAALRPSTGNCSQRVAEVQDEIVRRGTRLDSERARGHRLCQNRRRRQPGCTWLTCRQ